MADEQEKAIDFTVELAEDVWISICRFLEPFERFIVSSTSKAMYEMLSMAKYPFFSFYKSDLNYWCEYIEYLLSDITEKDTLLSHIPSYGVNLYGFDELDVSILKNIKYFIIFYEKLSTIHINKEIEKNHHQMKDENKMKRFDDEQNEESEDEMIEKQMEMLQIADINEESKYFATQIISIYLHEIQNKNQAMIHWICDVLRNVDSNCAILSEIFFDDSHLNNQSINLLCNALESRCQPLFSLARIYFGTNEEIGDECIQRLLCVLKKQCPNLVHLGLDGTGITNKTCEILLDFYKGALVMNDEENIEDVKNKLPKLEMIDLSGNFEIRSEGVDLLNEIFLAFDKFNEKYGLKGNDAIKLKLKIDVASCNWSDYQMKGDCDTSRWSDNIMLFYD